jgi:hypothetical protein
MSLDGDHKLFVEDLHHLAALLLVASAEEYEVARLDFAVLRSRIGQFVGYRNVLRFGSSYASEAVLQSFSDDSLQYLIAPARRKLVHHHSEPHARHPLHRGAQVGEVCRQSAPPDAPERLRSAASVARLGPARPDRVAIRRRTAASRCPSASPQLPAPLENSARQIEMADRRVPWIARDVFISKCRLLEATRLLDITALLPLEGRQSRE